MCRVLQVFRSGYYRWLKRKPSKRERENQRLDAQIREIYDQSKGRMAVPKSPRSFEIEVPGSVKTVWPSGCE
jgi:hypothetical protein